MKESVIRTSYSVWDRGVRWFHWINVLCLLGLIGIGVMIIYSKELEIGGDGKILLKTWHVYFGYVFATNLLFRFVWAFIGGHYSRWRAFLPSGKGFVQSLVAYVRSLFGGVSKRYIGHNPLARLMISFMFLLMLTQAVTGLILAGTDVYMPPLGSYFAEMVTNGDEEKLAQLKPGSKEFVDPDAYAQMREFRAPIIDIHNYVFYALLITIFMHITAVVLIEVTRRSGIISAMFSGEQWYDGSEDK